MALLRKLPVLLFLFCFQPGLSQQVQDSLLHRFIATGIDLTLRQRYNAADSVFLLATLRFPENPSGILYRAAVLQTRSLDYVVPLARESFDSLLAISERISENMMQKDPNSPWGYYFLAMTYGYDAFARVERGDWFGGFRKGLSSASYFKDCLDKDSLFYDACAGVGTYYYWKSRKIEFLQWLPFFVDSRLEGIRLLDDCSRKGTYNRFVALSALVTIYLDAGDYARSTEAALEALRAYPLNRVFLWGLAEAQVKSGRTREAREAYERILGTCLDEKLEDPYSEILARFNIVRLGLELKDSAGIAGHLEKLLSYESYRFPEELRARSQQKFDEAKRIQGLLKNGFPGNP
ncbi:MAG: hypothetical protein HW374_1860 [Bacteroidetes bacterium]|nr:hypothetical protein [Bacteroidota bacterium]